MSNESCLLDLLAAARNGNGNLQRRTIGKYIRQHKRGILGAVGHCEEFDTVLVHRAKMEEKDFIDKMGVLRRCPTIRCCGERMPCHSHQMGSQSTRGPMTLLSYVLGGLPRSSVIVAVTNTSPFSETPDPALVKAVIAHAARRAEGEDIVVAVFDVRRAYFYAEEKRDTFVELPDCVPAEFRTTHVGKLRKALYGTRPAAASWRDELRKGLVSCRPTVGTVSRCCFHNELCSVAGTVRGDEICVAGPRQDIAKMEATLKKRWETP